MKNFFDNKAILDKKTSCYSNNPNLIKNQEYINIIGIVKGAPENHKENNKKLAGMWEWIEGEEK